MSEKEHGPHEYLRTHGAGQDYVRCDFCKSLALKVLIDQPMFEPGLVKPSGGGFPGLTDPMEAAMGLFKSAIPAPETRTERLLRAVLMNPANAVGDTDQDHELRPGEFVDFVRSIERELDAPIIPMLDPHAVQPWKVLSWPTRVEFERWVQGLMNMLESHQAVMGHEFLLEADWQKIAVSYVQQ